MNRPLALFFRTWALGLTAWALVYTREVPTALAQSVIETDCSTDLDQPNTTYVLTSDATNCIIAAANIILDGQNLYEISGDVTNNVQISGQKELTLRNLSFVGRTRPQGFSSSDVFSIENSTVHTFDGNYMYAAVHVTDSTIEDFSYGFSGGSITRSNITGRVSAWGDDLAITDSSITGNSGGVATVRVTHGDLTVTDSSVIGNSNIVVSDGNLTMIGSYTNEQVETSDSGAIIITDSTINHDTQAVGDVTITNSETGMIMSAEGDIAVTDSTVGALVLSTDGRTVTVMNSDVDSIVLDSVDDVSVAVTDSTIQGPVELHSGTTVVTNSLVYGNLDTYNYGNTTVTDSTIHGEISMYTGIASVTRSLVEGDVGRVGTLFVEDSIVTGDVNVTGVITLIDNPPSLVVTPLTLSLDYGEDFNPFEDVTATDLKDGDLGDDVVVIGTVGEEEGVYELRYSITDTGTTLFNIQSGGSTSTAGPSTASVTRTVTRNNKPIQSTSIGVHKERKEKQVAQEAALPADTTALIENLRTALEAPGSTNDPEALKQVIDLVRQLIVALLELLAVQGKVK